MQERGAAITVIAQKVVKLTIMVMVVIMNAIGAVFGGFSDSSFDSNGDTCHESELLPSQLSLVSLIRTVYDMNYDFSLPSLPPVLLICWKCK